MERRFEFSHEDLAALLAEVEAADVELCVRDLSGGKLLTQRVPASVKVADVILGVVAEAGLPVGQYALFTRGAAARPVRLDPSRPLGEALEEAGLANRSRDRVVEVVLAPELEGNGA